MLQVVNSSTVLSNDANTGVVFALAILGIAQILANRRILARQARKSWLFANFPHEEKITNNASLGDLAFPKIARVLRCYFVI